MRLLLLALFLCANSAKAYLYSRTWYGKKLKWDANQTQYFYVNPQDTNSFGVSSTDVENAIYETLDAWNDVSPVQFDPVFTTNLPALSTKASFRFSTNSAYFGSGVLAVTSLSYNSSSGTIYAADIMVNDTGFASSTITSSKSLSSGSMAYIGDIITHEFGHLLGLNHSETPGSSMVYSVFKGQYKVSDDEASGVGDLYSVYSYPSITGKVVGRNEIAVFGAYVQAIDLNDNKTVAGVFTDQDGEFNFYGLDDDKSYALYVSPIRSKDNLTDFYSTFRADFCSGDDFQPSFFSKCGGRNIGKAQVLQVSDNETLDVGSVTVKCSTPVNSEYLRAKQLASTDRMDILNYTDDYKSHSTFTGYFSSTEIAQGASAQEDRLQIDLSSLDVSSMVTPQVDIHFSTEKLSSALGLEVYVKRIDQAFGTYKTVTYDTDTFKAILDFTITMDLSSDSDDNIFEIDVWPVELSSSEQTGVFAAPSLLTNNNATYFVSTQVVHYTGSTMQSIMDWNDYPYEDNSSCLDSDPVETANSYNPASAGLSYSADEQPLSCGTVDFDSGSGPGSGLGSFVIGFLAIFFIFALRPRGYDFFV